MSQIHKVLLVSHIKVHNANALSSPYTIGFPAMTAFLGAVHALQRKVQASGWKVTFAGVGVVCHSMDLQTYRGPNDYVSFIVGTSNPLNRDGSRPSFIAEARCHLDLSLVIDMTGFDIDDEQSFCQQIGDSVSGAMKIAGGDILTFAAPEVLVLEDGNEQDLAKLNRKLMPGYALIERRELMIEAMEQGQDAVDALLDYLAIHHTCKQDDDGLVTWSSRRKVAPVKEGELPCPPGWIVPIATGFHGITPLATAKNQRDSDTPHRFAESVVTLGEFKMPYRLSGIKELLWHYYHDEENNLYLCQQVTEEQNDLDFY